MTAEQLIKPWRAAMFDLDGTLAASKSEISPAMVHMLRALLAEIDVCIISGGRFEQFEKQVLRPLGEFGEIDAAGLEHGPARQAEHIPLPVQ